MSDLKLEDLLKLVKPLSDQDEYKHDMLKIFDFYPPNWNESWYFNFISKIITRIVPLEKAEEYFKTQLNVSKDIKVLIDLT